MPLNLPLSVPPPILLAPMVPGLADTRLPLQGVTVLAVEDSRFASDALRLLCQRSGARLRRAESLEHAGAHLRCYRPDAVLVDLGLPDGRGEDLIRALSRQRDRPALLGMSGDPTCRAAALAAGADGFMEKPIAGLVAFQQALLALLPDRCSASMADVEVSADPAALHDDLSQVASALQTDPGEDQRRYLAGFLGGLARQSNDRLLSEASEMLRHPEAGLHRLARLLDRRLHESAPFKPQPPMG